MSQSIDQKLFAVCQQFPPQPPPYSFRIALKGLPLPTGLQENVILAAQYLELLLGEVQQMQRAAQCRGLKGTAGWLRYV